MNIYFLRHAQSMGNLTGNYSTDLHDSLSKNGIIQANDLSERLDGKIFNKIYCSPLKRAIKTIKPYIKKNNLKVEIWPELAESCWQEDKTLIKGDSTIYHEHCFLEKNDLPYFTYKQNKKILPVEHETYSQGISRLLEVKKLLESETEKNDSILIVSHAFTISRLIELLINLPPNGIFDFENTSISKIVTENNQFKVRYINRI